jgi:hypothetical protein
MNSIICDKTQTTKIESITCIKLLNVSAQECNLLGFHYNKLDLRSIVIVYNGLKYIERC